MHRSSRALIVVTLAGSNAVAVGPSCTPGWQPAPVGVPGTSAVIRALIVHDDGTGAALYAGGPFFTAGGVTVNSIAKWDGASWSALGTGMIGPVPTAAAAVNGLGEYDDGGGPALYAAGNLLTAGGVPANRIAKWNGAAWSALGDGLNQGAQALAAFDDGTGHQLYVGGSFTLAASVPNTAGIARWNGTAWSEVGGGVAGSCNVLLVYNDGTGEALYAGGTFFAAGGAAGTNYIAKWNGTAWSALAGGMSGGAIPTRVNALAVFDDGGGSALFAGGVFDAAGGVAATNLARWGGASWTPVGGGTDNTVIRMTLHDDGAGDALYVGGSFFNVGGAAPVLVNQIARWDGEAWDDLDGGVVHPTVTTVSGLAAFEGSLFVAGGFTTAGGQTANNIARWGCPDCYADCNEDGALTVADFGCFQTKFAAADPYADCNGIGGLTVADFGCFQTQFVAGCP